MADRGPLSAAELTNEAIPLHRSGALDQAERRYLAALAIDPRQFEALHLLGVVRLQQGNLEQAISLMGDALQVRPDSFDALRDLGAALSFAHRNEEAFDCLGKALALRPNDAELLNQRGEMALALNWVEIASADFERALVLAPEFADALFNLGNVQATEQRFEEALASYEGVLKLDSTRWEALNNRGNVLLALGRPDEALGSYGAALAAKPDEATPLFNRGKVLFDLQRLQDALVDFEAAIARQPDYVEALHARGSVLRMLKRHADAAQSFAEVLRLNGDFPNALGDAIHARMQLCDWTGYDGAVRSLEEGALNGRLRSVPFVVLVHSGDPAAQLACARTYARANYAVKPLPARRRPVRRDRIRLAYVSSKFHEHAGAHLIAELLERHDRQRFAVVGVSIGPDDSGAMRKRLIRGVDEFIDVRPLTDAGVANLLRYREIDIAIDLSGYVEYARPGILAFRPAPIQVSFLGYPGTTGADFIDYLIADSVVVPANHDRYFSERVVRLPGSYQVNDSKRRIGERTPTRAEVGLPDDGFVFCSFNNVSKITPTVFDVWMRVLGNRDGSVLWLLDGGAEAERNLRREAEARGVDPRRLVFAPRLPLAEHLARHRLADLGIDTLPYNAHVTASDALWAGLPLLTCSGRTFASRVAASLLHALNLPELVTESLAEYEARAVAFARSPALLQSIREKLARQRSKGLLFDTEQYRRHIETAYETMWEMHLRGEEPRPFTVRPTH